MVAAGVVGIGYLILKGANAVRSLNQLPAAIDPQVRVARASFGLLNGHFDLEVEIRNPISQGIAIKYPVVRLKTLAGGLIGQSDPNGQPVRIDADSVTRIPIRINYSTLNAAPAVLNVIKDAIARKPVSLKAQVDTAIITGDIRTEITKDVTINLLNV